MKMLAKNRMTLALGLALASCSVREDVVFSAFDELHYLQLYEKNNEFEILHNGLNTAQGRYQVKGDTILLNYLPGQFTVKRSEELDGANAKLTRIVIIDRKQSHIRSADKHPFCAQITVNRLTRATSIQ
ncbi:hypothetical protein [Hymenobacter cellulosilyticus]|uniref:Lipoprotein n=1 Tax=Hymenobacter cellulosilyticus TaxID=2932248 RepID=A0A8T9QEP9_9BACT|nr:hypothetical protein [Hymenobacter cellulosilyticus]UOQ74638.1 hypothetical protein MUN79_12655 [Hymenobacter cellulosilyticus]